MIIHNNNRRTIEIQEETKVQNFINEMMLLIPKQQDTIASKILLREILNYPLLSYTAYETLLEQNFFLDALDQIREYLCLVTQKQ
jgi:hypothetical protein